MLREVAVCHLLIIFLLIFMIDTFILEVILVLFVDGCLIAISFSPITRSTPVNLLLLGLQISDIVLFDDTEHS